MHRDKFPIKRIGEPSVVSARKLIYPGEYLDTVWHMHDNGLLACVEHGAVGFQTEDRSFVVSAGMTVYVPPFFPHFESSMGSVVSILALSLPVARIKFMGDEFQILQTSRLLGALAQKIVSWGAVAEVEKSSAQKRLVLTFLDELSQAEPAEHLSIPYPKTKSLCLIADEIISQPGDMRTIDYWAKVAGMSRRSFTKYFSQETGLSFAVWRNRVKLRTAMKALALGESISSVAARLGYQNVSSFGVVFKKQFGQAPLHFKRDQAAGLVDVGPDSPSFFNGPAEVGTLLREPARRR